MSFMGALDSLTNLRLLSIHGPHSTIIRIIRCLTPHTHPETLSLAPESDDLPYPPSVVVHLPKLTHLEIKLTNGRPCIPLFSSTQYHCTCFLESHGYPDDVLKLVQTRYAEKPALEYLKLSRCLAQHLPAMKSLVKKIECWKCSCYSKRPSPAPAANSGPEGTHTHAPGTEAPPPPGPHADGATAESAATATEANVNGALALGAASEAPPIPSPGELYEMMGPLGLMIGMVAFGSDPESPP
ncbi:hypothetical protein DL93DRAFT_2071887 [Clavulina sp. PMI_390]|nr:hypothetical protein DL93DRAFT_2071887 [Clavulina sp. PMI_390]